MTSDELAFIAALDAEPENHWLRCVYADWLDDRGDPRGPGMRALGRLERVPWYWRTDNEIGFFDDGYVAERQLGIHPPSLALAILPRTWLQKIPMMDYVSSRGYKTRAAAEDAAALAWAKLTLEQQVRILADAGVMV